MMNWKKFLKVGISVLGLFGVSALYISHELTNRRLNAVLELSKCMQQAIDGSGDCDPEFMRSIDRCEEREGKIEGYYFTLVGYYNQGQPFILLHIKVKGQWQEARVLCGNDNLPQTLNCGPVFR